MIRILNFVKLGYVNLAVLVMNTDLVKMLGDKYFVDKPQGDAKHPDHRFDVRVGDTVVVYSKIVMRMKVQQRLTAAQKQALKKALAEGKTMEEIEEQNIKTQPFRGVVIAIKGHGKHKKITVRRIASGGIGVEKIFPLFSPVVERVEIIKQGDPRRAKLYYLRNRVGRKATKVKGRSIKPETTDNNKVKDVEEKQSSEAEKEE